MNGKIIEQKKNEWNEANEPVGTRSTASHSSGDIWDVVEHVPTRCGAVAVSLVFYGFEI
jgi:hypothetical protein